MRGIGPGRRLPTVLIIDDDMVSREVLGTVLSMSGYTVHTACDGAQSLSILDAGNSSPEVILMDTQMPGLSGVALIEELRKRSKAKIYAMSGSDAPRAVIAGADGFLPKPLGPEALQIILEQHAPEVSPGMPQESPAIGPAALAQLRSMMPEHAVREIYSVLLEDLDKRTIALQCAIQQRDAAEVRRLGHAIKGGCGMTGVWEIARLGERLEAESDQLDNSATIVSQLQGASRRLRRMLEAEFPTAGNPHV